MILRDATAADVPAIAAIWNLIVRDTAITFWPDERSHDQIAALIAERQAAGQAFIVAADGDRLLGFCTYSQFRGGAGYARSMEHTIHAAPDARGRGVGRAMLIAVQDHARQRGHRILIGGITVERGLDRLPPGHGLCRMGTHTGGGMEIRAVSRPCADGARSFGLACRHGGNAPLSLGRFRR